MAAEKEAVPQGGFRNPALTVDGVVLVRPAEPGDNDCLSVLLVERGNEPFRGRYALPGGFVDYGEDVDAAIGREVLEETGLGGLEFRQFHTFGQPGRDPRGHTVSVVYIAELRGELPFVAGGDDAADALWFDVRELPELAFDHGRILAMVLESLSS